MNVALDVDVDMDIAADRFSNMLKVSLITWVSLIPVNSLSSIFTCPHRPHQSTFTATFKTFTSTAMTSTTFTFTTFTSTSLVNTDSEEEKEERNRDSLGEAQRMLLEDRLRRRRLNSFGHFHHKDTTVKSRFNESRFNVKSRFKE